MWSRPLTPLPLSPEWGEGRVEIVDLTASPVCGERVAEDGALAQPGIVNANPRHSTGMFLSLSGMISLYAEASQFAARDFLPKPPETYELGMLVQLVVRPAESKSKARSAPSAVNLRFLTTPRLNTGVKERISFNARWPEEGVLSNLKPAKPSRIGLRYPVYRAGRRSDLPFFTATSHTSLLNTVGGEASPDRRGRCTC
jgi:hypothetical protein